MLTTEAPLNFFVGVYRSAEAKRLLSEVQGCFPEENPPVNRGRAAASSGRLLFGRASLSACFSLADAQNTEYLADFNTWLRVETPEGGNQSDVRMNDLQKPLKRPEGFVLFNVHQSRTRLREMKKKNERK